MSKPSFSTHGPSMAMLMALMVSFTGLGPIPAQPTQALIEDWRASDFNHASSMMAADQSDHVYVLGDTATSRNLIIKKFDAAGALLWQAPYDAVEALSGVWIVVDGNGNAIVQANTIRSSTGQPTGWLTLKYDTDGNLLWADSRPGIVSGSVRVQVDSNNNIYVAGYALNDSVLVKYSPAGTTLWTAVFDNNGAIDMASSMVISPDGSRIGVAGISGNLFMALMYDANGNRLWANTNSGVYAADDVAFGPGNISYFAAGAYFPQDPNPYQMAIVKFDAAGNQSWIKTFSLGDRALRVAVDAQGSIVATGVDTIGYMDWVTIKTDANGNLLWSQRYDGGRNNDEIPNMLAIDAAGAVYVTGKGGPNPGSGNLSYVKGVAVKYNPDGTPQWAVWDDYAGGKAIRLGAGNTLATLGWNYLVTTHYTQTGLPDLPPNPPTNLSGFAASTDASYEIRLNFSDNANNEFWVEAERCAGLGCTNFTTVAQSRGENVTGLTDTTVAQGMTYTYRVRARGFMGLSGPSNTATIITPGVICPDFNHNGVVDSGDLSAIASLWGQSAPAGYDLDGDGFVTIADIQIAAARWGTSCP